MGALDFAGVRIWIRPTFPVTEDIISRREVKQREVAEKSSIGDLCDGTFRGHSSKELSLIAFMRVEIRGMIRSPNLKAISESGCCSTSKELCVEDLTTRYLKIMF